MKTPLDAFANRVGFLSLNQADQIRSLAWFLHTVSGKERLVTSDFRECFQALHLEPPNISRYLSYLSEGKGRAFIRDRKGFRLEAKCRARLGDAYSDEIETVQIRKLLSDTVGGISDAEQRIFADEALRCFSVKAFRASIVMTWNLAYDHLCRWLHADPTRLSAFNASLLVKYPKNKTAISKFQDFADLKEFEVVETCAHAKLISKNLSDLLKEKLKRRNAAAHPSTVAITQAQAEDVITDLVANVLKKLV